MSPSQNTPKPDPAIMRLRQIRKSYLSGEVETPVLHGVDLDIPASKFIALLGESGSGKTTLMNIVGAIDRPDSGTIHFRDTDLTTLTDPELTQFRRKEVGFVFQLYNLVPTLTALENVWAAAELSDDPMDPAHALDLVGLADRQTHFPSQLSGGQQQRVAIARAIAKRPALLLCDEPTGALDHETSITILALIQRLAKETDSSIIMITHSRAITAICDRVVTIVDGIIDHELIHDNPIDAAELAAPPKAKS